MDNTPKKISDIVAEIVETKSYKYIRPRLERSPEGFILYDCFNSNRLEHPTENDELEGKKKKLPRKMRGVVLLDLFTASAIHAVYTNLKNEKNKNKLNTFSLPFLIEKCYEWMK